MTKVVRVKNNVVRLPSVLGRKWNGRKILVVAGTDQVVLKPIHPGRASEIAGLLPPDREPPIEKIAREVRKARRRR